MTIQLFLSIAVGLYACFPGDKKLSTETVIKFQTIKASTGIIDLASFKSTGKFTCEVSGFYVIFVVISLNTDESHYEVLRNNNRISDIFPPKSVHDWYTTSSSVVSMNLNVKDTVFVKTIKSMTISSNHGISCISIIKT